MHIGLQELQEAKQVSLCQPRARPTTRVALPGLGQTHSGYMRERSQMSTRTLLERRTAPGPPGSLSPLQQWRVEGLTGGCSSLEPLQKLHQACFLLVNNDLTHVGPHGTVLPPKAAAGGDAGGGGQVGPGGTR